MYIRVDQFSGMIPILDDQLLPGGNAVLAENTSLYGGNLTGFKPDREIRSLTNPAAKKIFRIPLDITMRPDELFSSSVWMEFVDEDTDIVRSPVNNDEFARFYWASPSTGLRYNTTARIQAGQADYKVGIPQPLTPPDVSPTDTASEVEEVRAYVYTFVSAYGEEGPPSAAVLDTGKADSVWTITVAGATLDQATDRNLENIRIYRTITSSAGVASYFFVVEIPISQNVYVDTLSNTLVAGQGSLLSTPYTAPPENMQGIIAMPNGMLVGWESNNIYFCQPYLPHAWPAAYGITVDYPIVGMAVINQTLCVMTTAFPSTATGVNPASIAQSRINTLEPCLSRASIMTAPEGVYYASPNGLVKVSPGAVGNITDILVERTDWQNIVDPWTLRATRYGTAYMAFNAPRDGAGRGVLIDPQSARAAYSYLVDDRAIQTLTQDPWTGETFAVYDSKVWHIDPPNLTVIGPFVWLSKIYVSPKPVNNSVLRVDFLIPEDTEELNDEPDTNLTIPDPLDEDRYGYVEIYADGAHVATKELRETRKIQRLPAGFKAREWQFKITSRVIIQTIEIATSVQRLTAGAA